MKRRRRENEAAMKEIMGGVSIVLTFINLYSVILLCVI